MLTHSCCEHPDRDGGSSCAAIAFVLQAPRREVQLYLRAMGCLALLVEAPSNGMTAASGMSAHSQKSRAVLGRASVGLEALASHDSVSGEALIAAFGIALSFAIISRVKGADVEGIVPYCTCQPPPVFSPNR